MRIELHRLLLGKLIVTIALLVVSRIAKRFASGHSPLVLVEQRLKLWSLLPVLLHGL